MKPSMMRVILFAKDMDRQTAFYRDVLGLTPCASPHPPSEWVDFDSGGARLALHAIPERYAKNIEISDPPKARGGTPYKPVFRVEDLRAACAELKAAGVPRLFPNEDEEVSTRADFLDPEGNVFQLTAEAIG